jgi:SpoVK/Ycf46/Vps4 family AAA+-type ATPase
VAADNLTLVSESRLRELLEKEKKLEAIMRMSKEKQEELIVIKAIDRIKPRKRQKNGQTN